MSVARMVGGREFSRGYVRCYAFEFEVGGKGRGELR